MAEWNPQANELFLNALDCSSPEQRQAYLDQACADAALRAQVEALLAAHDQAGSFLDTPVVLQPAVADQEPGQSATGDNPGLRIGPYRLLQKLGEGGMGTVWVAEQTEPVKRRVALKLIKAGMDSAQVLRRFEQERQALALMDHSNIAKVFDAGTADNARPYFVMELVKGVPITKYCDELHLPLRERLALFGPVCAAIQHAHQKGVIHRDLKPSNVLVAVQDGKPVPKIIDFGVAKALHQQLTEQSLSTEIGQVLGTLEYMSPEQAELSTLDVDTRADVYALGVVLYELLTGTTPLDRKRLRQAAFMEMLRLIREEEPPKPSNRLSQSKESLATLAAQRRTEPAQLTRAVRGELDWIVMKCLEKDRTRRYETASSLARDLERHLQDEPEEAHPPGAGYRLGKVLRKHRSAVATATAFVGLLLVGVLVSLWLAVRARQQTDRAEMAEGDASAKATLAESRRGEADQERTRAVQAEREAKAKAQLAEERRADAERQTLLAATNEQKAKEQAELAHKVKDLLVESFRSPDPYVAGDKVTVAQVLKQAERQIDKLDQPLLQEELLVAIGRTYLSLKLPDGVKVWEKVVALQTKRLGADHPDTLSSVNNLAYAYQTDGQVKKALPLFQETLEKFKVQLGADHRDTLNSMSNLAHAYQADGQVKKAIALFKETLAKQKAKLGADHPDTLRTMSDLARAYQADGQVKQALPLFEETLAKQKVNWGADRPDTLDSMNNLAKAYLADGQVKKALPLFEETLAKRKVKLGADHPQTLASMNNLASVYQADGQLKKALPLFEDTLEKFTVKLGPDHPDTLNTMANLAVAYREAGKLAQAIGLLEEVLDRARKRPDGFPAQLAWVASALAVTYDAAGQFAKAEPLYRGVEEQASQQFGASDGRTSEPLAQLGLNLLKQQKYVEAKTVLRACLKIRAAKQPDAWTTFDTQSMLGDALLGQKKYAEAEPLLLQGYEGIKQRAANIPTPGRVRLIEALERLVQLYEATGQKEKAADWRQLLEQEKTAQTKPKA